MISPYYVVAIGYKSSLSNTIFQHKTVGSMSIVPIATFVASSASPILYCFAKENDAIDIGKVAMRMAAL